jgi:hypothetical protein
MAEDRKHESFAQSDDVVAEGRTPEQKAEHERRQAESDKLMAEKRSQQPEPETESTNAPATKRKGR